MIPVVVQSQFLLLHQLKFWTIVFFKFKFFLMMKLGYIGKEGDVWIKEPKQTEN